MTDANKKRIGAAFFGVLAIEAAVRSAPAQNLTWVWHFGAAIYFAYVAIGFLVELVRPGTL